MISSFFLSGLAHRGRAKPDRKKEGGWGGCLPRAAASAALPWAIVRPPLRGSGKASQTLQARPGRAWPDFLARWAGAPERGLAHAIAALVTCLLLSAGCGSVEPANLTALTQEAIVLPEYAVAGVNYADGLSRAEAELVAADDFRRFVGSCGMPDKPRDRGAFWCVRFWGGMLARDEGQLWMAKDGSRSLLQPPSKGLPSATKVLLQGQGIAYE